MRKTRGLVSLIGALALSSSVYAQSICSVDEECNDEVRYTQDMCVNNTCSSEYKIKNSRDALLRDISDKLTDLNNKDYIVNVSPPEVTVNENITIEPPQVDVFPNISVEYISEMPRRGNINLRRRLFVQGTNPDRTIEIKNGDPYFVSLPSGNCSLSISTDGTTVNVSEAKSTSELGGGFSGKDGLLMIDDEYFMAKISANNVGYMDVAYNCQ